MSASRDTRGEKQTETPFKNVRVFELNKISFTVTFPHPCSALFEREAEPDPRGTVAPTFGWCKNRWRSPQGICTQSANAGVHRAFSEWQEMGLFSTPERK